MFHARESHGIETCIVHSFELTLRHPPDPTLDAEAKAREVVKLQRRQGMTQAEAAKTLSELAPAYERVKQGFVSKGRATVIFFRTGSKVSTIVPILNGPLRTRNVCEVYDGKETIATGLGLHTWLLPGDRRTFLARPADRLALVGELASLMHLVEARAGADGVVKVYRAERAGRHPEVITTFSNATGEVFRIVTRSEPKGGKPFVSANYEITRYDRFEGRNVPSRVVVKRGPFGREVVEEYVRVGTSRESLESALLVVRIGDVIIDRRLGDSDQISYRWSGAPLSTSEVRRRAYAKRNILLRSNPWSVVGVGIGVVLITYGVILRRRGRAVRTV